MHLGGREVRQFRRELAELDDQPDQVLISQSVFNSRETCTLHPVPCTLNPEPCTQNPAPRTLNPEALCLHQVMEHQKGIEKEGQELHFSRYLKLRSPRRELAKTDLSGCEPFCSLQMQTPLQSPRIQRGNLIFHPAFTPHNPRGSLPQEGWRLISSFLHMVGLLVQRHLNISGVCRRPVGDRGVA